MERRTYMKLALCDDNAQDLCRMEELAAQYDPNMEIFSFSSAEALYESTLDFDAVLLDRSSNGPGGESPCYHLCNQLRRIRRAWVRSCAAVSAEATESKIAF